MIKFSIATKDDLRHLDHFDYTKLTAINTCPTWGIIRYGLHKTMPGAGRSTALDAGHAAHEAFAAIRLVQLGHPAAMNMREHMHEHGQRLFSSRWDYVIQRWNDDDIESTTRNVTLDAFASTEYVDDPNDNRRTYAKIEEALLVYATRWDHHRYPIYVADANDPTALVGIEIPFAIRVDLDNRSIVYTGRIDGLHRDRNGELICQENKTASRIDEAWRMSFETSHQVTGYTIAASVLTNEQTTRGMVFGLQLPQPVRNNMNGLAIESVRRPMYMRDVWETWLRTTLNTYYAYHNDPLTAPKYTHSCNRYFRPCSFIPLCAQDPDEQRIILDEMVHDEWSPLDDKVGD